MATVTAPSAPLRVVLTGATGYVGEGVLLECLNDPSVESVLIVNRRHLDIRHPKLSELVVADFTNLGDAANQLQGYDACFFCAGISSVGVKPERYEHVTYTTTIAFAQAFLKMNPSSAFHFVTGAHTDSTEKGSVRWARVKGKTENALLHMGFRDAYMYRPGAIKPMPGQRTEKTLYNIAIAIIGLFMPSKILSVKDIAHAMINTTIKGYKKAILEIADIKAASAMR